MGAHGGLARNAWIVLAAAATLALGSIVMTLSLRGRPAASPLAEAVPPSPAALIAQQEARARTAPGDAENWLSLGRSYFAASRHADAAGAYARAARLQPGRAATWSALGEAQTLAANAVDPIAHAAFAKAVALDPKDARARYFLGVEKDVAGDHRGAIDDWIALLGDAPPGAPWAASVRELVLKVAAKEKIAVADRLPAMPSGPAVTGDVASAAIPGPTPEQMRAASAMTPGQQEEMARGMVATLAGRLAQNPHDAEGWIRLMRAEMVLGDRAAATRALADARHAFAGDAATLAALADAQRTLGVPAR